MKKYICLDLEMSEFKRNERLQFSNMNGEVIQFGAVMLDEDFNLISSFNSFIKPQYSSVDAMIQKITGISNSMLEGQEDFVTVFDRFVKWRGEGDITSFVWNMVDHRQLFNELSWKAPDEKNYFAALENFVDLQRIFGRLLCSKNTPSLENALLLMGMKYDGQAHNAYWDAFNTGRIAHKLYCTNEFRLNEQQENPMFNVTTHMTAADKIEKQKKGRLTKEEFFDLFIKNDLPLLESVSIKDSIEESELIFNCERYRIKFVKFIKFINAVSSTHDMKVLEN